MEQLRIVAPGIVGFHHVRLPVTDVFRSRDWYIETLGFRPMLVEETADGVLGVALRHGCGAVIGLHQDAVRARALSGFSAIALGVDDLRPWVEFLGTLNLLQEPSDSHLGRSLRIEDPDGIVIELHTISQPSAADA